MGEEKRRILLQTLMDGLKMDIKSILKENIIAVKKEFDKLLAKKRNERGREETFREQFYDEFENYLTDGGKRIRPFLVKSAFEAVGGDNKDGNIFQAAIALELLHNGSLLHDDVIDKDETRRGRPSFHVIFRELYKRQRKEATSRAEDFGNAMAIFAGDLCFPLAIESIILSGFPEDLSIKALNAFSSAFRKVIDGVILEIGATLTEEATEEEYNKIIELKTAALIEKACEIGAILGGGTESQINALKEYCNSIGRAFQVQDDILGVFGDPEELGKPVGGDVRENKQTILRIYAMKNGSKEQISRLSELMGKEDLTEEELEEVKRIYKESAALEYSHKLITIETRKAIESLQKADPPLKEEPMNHLILLSNFLEKRKS